MKSIQCFLLSVLTFSSLSSMAAPAYTLQEICNRYAAYNQCAAVPFCQAVTQAAGCQAAADTPAYMDSACRIQSTREGCALMEANGYCAWVDYAKTTCTAKNLPN
jgi:hypothetical protein